MMFFLLIAACFASEATKTTLKFDIDGTMMFQFDTNKMNAVFDKCVNALNFNFKLTKEDEKYYVSLFKNTDCSGEAYYKHEMEMVPKALELPVFMEGIKIDADVSITVAEPFGCMLKMLPDLNDAVKGELNMAFVNTQFGVSLHKYSEGECEGVDTIKQIIGKITEGGLDYNDLINIEVGETSVQLPQNIDFLKNMYNETLKREVANMLQEVKKSSYEYAENLPKLTDEMIYEYLEDGKMKVYQLIDGQMQYVKDYIASNSDKIINTLTNGDSKIFITGDCDNGIQFGWNGKVFQEFQIADNALCNIDLSKFEFGFPAEVLNSFASDGKITIGGTEYTIDAEEFKKHAEKAGKVIVESLGSMMEFDLGDNCYPTTLDDIFVKFQAFVKKAIKQELDKMIGGNALMQQLVDTETILSMSLEQVKSMFESFKQSELMANFELKYSYSIGSIELTVNGEKKEYATYQFYVNVFSLTNTATCGGFPMFELIIGEIEEGKSVEQVKTDYSLTRYLDKASCEAKKEIEGFVKEHVQIDVCINGYKYTFENNELKKVECTTETVKRAAGDVVVLPCGTCVECAKAEGLIKEGEYAYVDCGDATGTTGKDDKTDSANSIFMIAMIFLIFVLF